jgi:hypothetical protein
MLGNGQRHSGDRRQGEAIVAALISQPRKVPGFLPVEIGAALLGVVRCA